jgi:hypothetical protein
MTATFNNKKADDAAAERFATNWQENRQASSCSKEDQKET